MRKSAALLLLLPLLLASCDHFGSGKVKNIVDLTPRITVEAPNKINFTSVQSNAILNSHSTRYQLAKHPIIASEYVASQDIVYSLDNKGYVSAFSLKAKKIIWSILLHKHKGDHNYYSGGILHYNDEIFITNGSRDLIILDAQNGTEKMRKKFSDILRNKPAIFANNTLLVQTISNQFFAYDIKQAKLLWMHEGGLETISSTNHVAPTIYNSNVLVSYSSGEVVYIDIKTGDVKWVFHLIDGTMDMGLPNFESAAIITPPIIKQNYVYFATSNGKLVKIDLDNGAAVWQKQIDDIQSMSLLGENLFLTTNARQVAALSAHNGKVIWVGDLISDKDKTANKNTTVAFQAPFVGTLQDNSLSLNIIGSNGELYSFILKDGVLQDQVQILKIDPAILCYWLSQDTLHMIIKNKLIIE